MKSKRKGPVDKPTQKPESQIVATGGNPPMSREDPSSLANQIPTKLSEAELSEHHDRRRRATGTDHPELRARLFFQTTNAISDAQGKELFTIAHVQQALMGIAPKDELEGLMAAQIVAFHSLIMDCMRSAVHPEQTDRGVEAYVNRAAKLSRTFTALTEALGRYRSRGQQRMTVEHIHVHPGGRAIVGQINTEDTRIRGNGTNGD